MKTKTLFLMIALAFIGHASSFGQNKIPQRTYTALKANNKIVIDGKLDDADWQRVPFTEDFADISGFEFPKPKYRTRAKILWDDDYIYFGAEMEEPYVTGSLTHHDDIIYRDNDFEVFIDPDGDGINYYEYEMNALNTTMDLFMPKAYRDGGDYLMQYNFEGLRSAVNIQGTLNDSTDQDRGWSVEIAIPRKNFMRGGTNLLKEGQCWRVNFSRVEHLKKKGPEENWVWNPTGKIDMHMPDQWGYVFLQDSSAKPVFPYDRNVYHVLWAMYYAQRENHEKTGKFITQLKDLKLSASDKALLPADAHISMQGGTDIYRITIKAGGKTYSVDQNGECHVL